MPKRKYRMLKDGEMIKKGDEAWGHVTQEWHPASMIGHRVADQFGTSTDYRRPLRRKHAPR